MYRPYILLFALLVGCTSSQPFRTADPRQQVWDTELAFAATMAERDHAAFTAFLSEDAIFFGGTGLWRGKSAVAAAWKPYFEGPTAPFSWEPDMVEVLDSGDLALSSGPVSGPNGAGVGRFNSIWRLEPDGWRVVLDKGEGGN